MCDNDFRPIGRFTTPTSQSLGHPSFRRRGAFLPLDGAITSRTSTSCPLPPSLFPGVFFSKTKGENMERKTADEYPQELLDLFHEYQHGDIDRRAFLRGTARFAVGGLTVAAIFESLTPNYAWSQTIAKNDKD